MTIDTDRSQLPRVLLAITVFNGGDSVKRCLQSASHLSHDNYLIDVGIFDDCSPDTKFAAEIAELCDNFGFNYYRSPVNLGIPRNVNLALLTGYHHNYDYVCISNSDVIYGQRSIELLISSLEQNPQVASLTAYSNNVSIYSIPTTDGGQQLANQNIVDQLQEFLFTEFRYTVVSIPAGISFAIAIPRWALAKVGLMDPVFGRGYCEELDWTLRSKAAGYTVGLCPSAFVYHEGSASNLSAGLLKPGETTVPENEQIIDHRYPLFRRQVRAYQGSVVPALLSNSATRAIMDGLAQNEGYLIDEETQIKRKASLNSKMPTFSLETIDEYSVSIVGKCLGLSAVINTQLTDPQLLQQFLEDRYCRPANKFDAECQPSEPHYPTWI